MYIAICDDQVDERNQLIDVLYKWSEEHHTSLRYKAYDSADELLKAAEKERFTLYLLDVMMPGMSGMEAAREIRSFDTAADIVFLTSSPNFAYESYSVKATEYILKPFSEQTIFQLIDGLRQQDEKLNEGITLKIGAKIIRVPFSQLSFVEVKGKHLYFNMSGGQVREVSGALKDYEIILLSRPEFMRIHRSYIVNMFQVAELSQAGVKTFSGKDLPISRLLYPQIQKDYVELLFSSGNTIQK